MQCQEENIVLVGKSSSFALLAFAESQTCLYGGRLQGGQTNVGWQTNRQDSPTYVQVQIKPYMSFCIK